MKMKVDPYLISPELTVALQGTRFPLEYLFRGLLVVGQPGAGKTRNILMPLLREILKTTGQHPDRKAGLVIADPKNELAPFIQNLAQEFGRGEDVVIFKPGDGFYNPLCNPFLTDGELVEKLIVFSANTHRSAARRAGGDEMFWGNAQRSLLGAIVVLARTVGNKRLTFGLLDQMLDKVNRFGSPSEATTWLQDHHAPTSAIRAITDYLRLPADTTRPCVYSSVANTLQAWRREPLISLTRPSELLTEIDPFSIIDQGKILVIGCSSAAYGGSITPLLLALKEHFFTALLSRDQIEVQSSGEWRLINQERPIFFIADEFQSYLTPDSSTGELTALDRLRGFHAGYIGATQNLASLHSVLGNPADATRLIALFSNQIYMANTCPYTTNQASWIMGNKRQRKTMDDHVAPPLLSSCRTRSIRPRIPKDAAPPQPRVDAGTLAALKTGEFWLRLANGNVYRKAAALSIAQIPPRRVHRVEMECSEVD